MCMCVCTHTHTLDNSTYRFVQRRVAAASAVLSKEKSSLGENGNLVHTLEMKSAELLLRGAAQKGVPFVNVDCITGQGGSCRSLGEQTDSQK